MVHTVVRVVAAAAVEDVSDAEMIFVVERDVEDRIDAIIHHICLSIIEPINKRLFQISNMLVAHCIYIYIIR